MKHIKNFENIDKPILENRKWKIDMKKEPDKDQNCSLCGSLDNVYALKAIKSSGATGPTLNICETCIKEINEKINKYEILKKF